MADYDSSLPVRTENPADVAATIVDSTGANNWSIDASGIGKVNVSDGTNDLAIDTNGYLGNVIWDAAGTNSWAIQTGGYAPVMLTDLNDIAEIDATESGLKVAIYSGGTKWGIDTNGSGFASIRDDSGANTWNILADNRGPVELFDTDGDELAINTDGSINVNMVQSTVGDDIHVYDTTASAVPATPETVVDYTVTTAKTLLLKSYYAACSGKAKFELKTGPSAGELTKHVGFLSTSSGQAEITFPQPIEVVAGDKVLVIITNMDKANADVYAAINGSEV